MKPGDYAPKNHGPTPNYDRLSDFVRDHGGHTELSVDGFSFDGKGHFLRHGLYEITVHMGDAPRTASAGTIEQAAERLCRELRIGIVGA